MHQHSSSSTSGSVTQPKRRKKRPIHSVKTVAVTRGRSGYGFTISGQHPCVLSCIVSGSPADEAGLKAGDYLMSVNSENVSKAPHDDVVRMVGISTGTLTLQVAENYNSSDSSDEDYHHRSKARYPNRIRTRIPTGGNKQGDKVLSEYNPRDRHNSNDIKHRENHYAHKHDHPRQSMSKPRLHVPVGAENNFLQPDTSTPQFAGPLSVERRLAHPVSSVHATPISHHPIAKQAIVKGISQSARSSHHNAVRPKNSAPLNSSVGTASMSSILKTSVNNATANNAFIAMEDEDEDDGEDESMLALENGGEQNSRVIVGYIGSIEMPSDANKPHIRVQSIRNAVRRLRIEQKVHTLVLMQVAEDGVKLTNAMGTTVAHYPVDRLAFSGVCPDDKRFFGIVTLNSMNNDDASSDNGSQDEAPSTGSCHVFMVDPEMRSHNIHADKAKVFGIICSMGDGERQNCAEFPRSATRIILSITNLYKNRQGAALDNDVVLSQAFADPMQAMPRRNSNSTSSNSDSGVGFSRGENAAVLVVDMPPPAEREAFSHVTPPQQNENKTHTKVSPNIMPLPTPLRDSQRVKSVHADVRSHNTSGQDDFSFLQSSEKFNIRAMPDPVFSSFGAFSVSSDGLDKQNSADTLRASMHKVLKARKTSNHSNDHESHSSELCRSQSHPELRRPESAPPIKHPREDSFTQGGSADDMVATVDFNDHRLSPRAFLPPPFHQLRSPSAPPMSNQSFEMEDMESTANTSIMGSLIERFEQDRALRISSPSDVSRRFSEGVPILRQREKEKTTVDDGERWAKPHSVRHRKMSRLQQPLSHSHESLVALESEISNHRLSSAGSANNIPADINEKAEEDEIGRIAGWAVSFEKLLQDEGGLVVFTEFLKKEFSEENIIFWRICEQYKRITDTDKRKTKAKEIFAKHISAKASDPINIEHVSRQQVELSLENPDKEIFDKPQLEIFKLMKQDSYARFIKSELYKKYLMREMEGQPLDLPVDNFQGILGSKELKEEKKKAAKSKDTEEKEKRRRSLLPWRQKSSKNSVKATSDSDLKNKKDKTPASNKDREVNNNQKKGNPGSGIDLSTIRREVQASSSKQNVAKVPDEVNFKFCRVILPDGSTTVVCAKQGQTIRTVLGKLCDKRSLSILAVDVFLLGSDKPLDLGEDISTLGSREVMIERRVLFRMDLPNRKSIGVKAKPNRTVRDVFKPILNKYGYKLDSICVQLSGQPQTVDIDAQVSSIDNQRVVIRQQEEVVVGKIENRTTSRRPTAPLVVKYPPDYHLNNSMEISSLDALTNQIFEDLMKGKSHTAHNFDELGILDPESSQQIPQKDSGDRPSLGLFGLRKKESPVGKGAQEVPKSKNKHKVTFNLQKNQTRKTPAFPDDDRFLDLLSKVQSDRLDDQRGLNTINSEIPEFLRNKSHYTSGRESAPPIMTGLRDQPRNSDDYYQSNTDNYASYTRGQVAMRPSSVSLDAMSGNRQSFRSYRDDINGNAASPNLFHGNDSFSADGIIPSSEEAQEYFQMTSPESADFDDPCMAEKSVRDLGFDYSFNKYQAKAYGYSRHRPPSSPRNDLSTEKENMQDGSLTPTNPDFDNTLLASPNSLTNSSTWGHSRSNSVPMKNSSSISTSNTPDVKLSSDYGLNIPKRSSDILNDNLKAQNSTTNTPKRGLFYERDPTHNVAMQSPPYQLKSPIVPMKVMTIDLDSGQEENVTFV